MARLAALAVVLFACAAAAALPVGEQIIKTRDGRSLKGVVLSETQQGYLFKMDFDTQLIPFTDIVDMQPAVVPDVAPPPPPPPVEPLQEPAPPPPPQRRHSDEPPPEEEPAAADWRSERKGMHWVVGAGGMVDPGLFSGGIGAAGTTVAGYVGVTPAIRWGFGWLDVQGEVMPMGYFKGNTKAFFLGLNPQLRINFARFYSLGVGLYGALVISPAVDFCVGPSISPLILRFGDLGSHEVRLWIATPAISTSTSLNGIFLLLLSYAYVF